MREEFIASVENLSLKCRLPQPSATEPSYVIVEEDDYLSILPLLQTVLKSYLSRIPFEHPLFC